MLLLLTWMLFWKGYCLVALTLISIPVIGAIEDYIRQSRVARQAFDKQSEYSILEEPNKQSAYSASREPETEKREGVVDYIMPAHLRVWEPETPPVIKAVGKAGRTPIPEDKEPAPENPVETQNQEPIGQGARKGLKRKERPFRNKKKEEERRTHEQLMAKEKKNREKYTWQYKYTRKGLHAVARELTLRVNEVADNTTTERELYRTLRLVIEQHPGLQNLPYQQALFQLLGIENGGEEPGNLNEAPREGW